MGKICFKESFSLHRISDCIGEYIFKSIWKGRYIDILKDFSMKVCNDVYSRLRCNEIIKIFLHIFHNIGRDRGEMHGQEDKEDREGSIFTTEGPQGSGESRQKEG